MSKFTKSEQMLQADLDLTYANRKMLNWEIDQKDYRLACYTLRDRNGETFVAIFQLWTDGNGYTAFKQNQFLYELNSKNQTKNLTT